MLSGRVSHQQATVELGTRPTVMSFDGNAAAYVNLTTSQTIPFYKFDYSLEYGTSDPAVLSEKRLIYKRASNLTA